MNRRTRLLLGITTTVGATLLLAWIMVQALILRPAIGEREPQRIEEAFDAADLMRSGLDKHNIEDLRGIDLRMFDGREVGPPPGDGWVRQETPRGILWKRDGGTYDIAIWTGEAWMVLHEDLPYASTLALAFLAAGIPVVILVFALTRRSQRYQDAAEASLGRLASGHLGERLNEQEGSREVRRLAVSVNRMASRLEALLASDRQRMAGLSHELRTPLTRIRLELELARRGGAEAERLDRVEADIQAFDTMLSEMLELSRLQLVGAAQRTLEVVDLAGLAQWVVDEHGWSDVEVRGAGTATVDCVLVARAIDNLLRNSHQHAPGSRRWVTVAEGQIQVGDDGPGIAPARRGEALQAFERGDASMGHGLGLAIVAQIVSLHDGELTLSDPPGLVVTLHLASAS